MSRDSEIYSSPWWLRGAHAQTMWSKLARRRRRLPLVRRSLATPDGDQVELHSLPAIEDAPHLLLLHGLEGSLRSHYVNGLLSAAARERFNAHVLLFRSCGTQPNRTKRFYHSGETEDARTAIDMLTTEYPAAEFFLAGVSLGGNVLLKYLGESPERVPRGVVAAAAVSVPYDLSSSAATISRGFSRVYQRFFLGSLKAKITEKSGRFSGLPPADQIAAVRTMAQFDDLVTAPLHGFNDAEDYYRRSSARHFLSAIKVPTLLLSSYDDPFLPGSVLARVSEEAQRNPALHIEFHRRGGHVGFVRGRWPWAADYYLDHRILAFFQARLSHHQASERLEK